jgi:hypothetical protein
MIDNFINMPKRIAKAKKAETVKKDLKPAYDESEQRKRVGNMFRDMEKYALVDFVNVFANVSFKLVNVKDNKNIIIGVKNQKDINCTCMDWRIRGKKNNINCKHILYVVSQILGLEYKISESNIISDYPRFEGAFNRIKINFKANVNTDDFKVREDRELTEEDVCPVCFTDFISGDRDNVINCTRCRGLVHTDCMACWLRNAVNKSCVYCGDKAITKGFGLK